MSNTSGKNLETRTLLDEFRNFDKEGFLDLGHPLLNRIAESFVKAAGIGAVQAVAREAYFVTVEAGAGLDSGVVPPEITGGKKRRFPDLRGETSSTSLEALVKNTGKESLQWGLIIVLDIILNLKDGDNGSYAVGLAAGMYSGLTYGLKEARGTHDWKNSAMAGAITGVALALTSDDSSHEQIVQSAITGAAISTAANLLKGIF
ncbi:hypothetical protein RHGRI_003208 [Rhododendron griersonianum]|uniref:Uncharacterized protein n=1 Tax=Rhododendron griersonianum TaxID=479676 RepID=A0AAV6L589_9ERIC|nr:hypothetical protein RHGRI_003208 [Rhododendron griersonianum]